MRDRHGRAYMVTRRPAKNGSYMSYSLTLPSHIAAVLSPDLRFTCDLTDAGILYRPMRGARPMAELPAWVKDAAGAAR